MAWKERPDGTWRKELGGVEKIYHFQSTIFQATGREHWGLYTSCKVNFAADVNVDGNAAQALRNAWKALRFEFPALTLVVDEYEAVYTCTGTHTKHHCEDQQCSHDLENATEEWVGKTFRVELLLTVEEIVADYRLRDLPVLIWLPTTSEVLFLTSHWRVDGIGSCMLLNRLFELVVAKPTVPPRDWSVAKDLAKISPSLEDGAGSPMVCTSEIENAAKEINTNFREKSLKIIGLPYNGDLSTPPGQPAVQGITFTPESSKALVDHCKARKISVAAAIHAALAAATFELASPTDTNEHVTIMAVSFRPYVKAPYNSEMHACCSYVSSITPTVPMNTSFEEQTTALTDMFKNWYTEKMSQALREVYRGVSQALLSPPPRPPTGPPPNPPSGITHSNLGVINRFIRGQYHYSDNDKRPVVEVTGFRFGVSIMTRQMLLYPWTFNEQLNLSINYNNAYYNVEISQNLLGRVQQKLEEELSVKLERSI